MRTRFLLSLTFFGALVAPVIASGAANAREQAKPDDLPAVFQAVVDCRTLAGEAERLACFDRTVAAMASAREQKDLVVADRETLRETKKGLFGFTLPKLRLFGGTEGEDVAQIETTITSVRSGKDGMAIFTLQDGAHWKQTDGGQSWARVGDKIVISRGALGSYLAKIRNLPPIRVLRLPN